MGTSNPRCTATMTTASNTGDVIEEYPQNGELYIIPGKSEDGFLFGKLQAV